MFTLFVVFLVYFGWYRV